jgi:soluble lytic murein transglycosylase-like protein
METRHKKTDTRTLSCCSTGAKLILAVALIMPALMALRGVPEGGKVPKVTEVLKIVEVVEKPRPKDLVTIYNIVKSHRSDITDSEAWRVSDVILEESLKRHLDPMLVVAVIEIESRFQYSAISPVGARGIMQIMPDTGRFLTGAVGRELGLQPVVYRPESLDDPILNIRMGVYYLHDLRKQFRNLHLALIAYNAGPAEVQNRLENNQEFSQEYANLVLDAYRRYTNRKAPIF